MSFAEELAEAEAALAELEETKDVEEPDLDEKHITQDDILAVARYKEARNKPRPANIGMIRGDVRPQPLLQKALDTALAELDEGEKPVGKICESLGRVWPRGAGVVTANVALSLLRPNRIAYYCEPQWKAVSDEKARFNHIQCTKFDAIVTDMQKELLPEKYSKLQISNVLWWRGKKKGKK